MLSGTKTHVRRKYLSEKSISGRACVLCVVFRFIGQKPLTCETAPLSVKPRIHQ